MDGFQQWALDWSPALTILFMFLICFFLWRTLKLMPKTKPVQIKPEAKSSIGWDDIAGVDDAKDELREVVEFLRDPKRFAALGARVPKGVLLHGPPGTGKTLLAKAVAHESGAQFFSQSAASFVEMFAGLGAARIRRLFREARKNAPAIIFIDELDAVGARRGSDNNGEREQTLNQLLVEMDGFNTSGDLVVMAASNLLEKLDPALLRPGRFDRQTFVSPPDVEGRERILEVHTRDKPVDGVDLSKFAARTSGLTGADLANLANEAAIRCARRGGNALTDEDFDQALERVIAGVQSRRVLNAHEKEVVAYHEAGHALVAELLPGVDRVHKISIVPRGKALGFTLNLPDEDRYLKTREELLDHMTVLLGGRVAEQLRLRRGHDGRVGRPQAGRAGLARDGLRLRDGHARDRVARGARRQRGLRAVSPRARRGAAGARLRSAARGARAHRRPARQARRARRSRCWSTRCSSARTSTGSWRA